MAAMRKLIYTLAVGFLAFPLQAAEKAEIDRWEHEAQHVTIIRDDWGIAHV